MHHQPPAQGVEAEQGREPQDDPARLLQRRRPSPQSFGLLQPQVEERQAEGQHSVQGEGNPLGLCDIDFGPVREEDRQPAAESAKCGGEDGPEVVAREERGPVAVGHRTRQQRLFDRQEDAHVAAAGVQRPGESDYQQRPEFGDTGKPEAGESHQPRRNDEHRTLRYARRPEAHDQGEGSRTQQRRGNDCPDFDGGEPDVAQVACQRHAHEAVGEPAQGTCRYEPPGIDRRAAGKERSHALSIRPFVSCVTGQTITRRRWLPGSDG